MKAKEIEQLFENSWLKMDKKRLMLVFFTLCTCGVFVVFSRVIGIQANMWVRLSLSLMPLFVSTTLLFALGIVLAKMTQNETSPSPKNFFQLMMHSMRSFNAILYLTLPLFFVYVLAWLVLGIFMVFKAFPAVGDFVSVFLSFGPFILIFCSLVLAFLNIVFLFFLTPIFAFQEQLSFQTIREKLMLFKKNLFFSTCVLALAAFPVFFILCFLIGAAFLTKMSYFAQASPLFIGLQWFFLMLPFNAVLTPFILFFFNFSSSVYAHLLRTDPEDRLVKKAAHSV